MGCVGLGGGWFELCSFFPWESAHGSVKVTGSE